ncbi:hypothetical protein [Paenirhodobacter populi]|nr:hypothetical protein [Sinirhodobacter populi]
MIAILALVLSVISIICVVLLGLIGWRVLTSDDRYSGNDASEGEDV